MIQQGAGFFVRKAAKMINIPLHIKHFRNEKGIEQIDTTHAGAMGFEGVTDQREMNGVDREEDDRVFGKKICSFKRISLGEIENEYLRDYWMAEVEETGLIRYHQASSTGKWISDQV
jgi:hypothetical protein